MTENLLRNFEVNEESLEGNLYRTGVDNDWSIVGIHLSGAKKLAIHHQKSHTAVKIPPQNHFVELKHTFVDGKAIIYPAINPSTKIEAEIKGYKPVFGGNCTLVLGECNDRQFVYFDPESRDYSPLLSTKQKIRLAAISSGTSYNDFESNPSDVFDKEQIEEFLRQGFAKSRLLNNLWQVPVYRTIFDITGIKSVQGENYSLQAKNPLDQSKALELVTASEEIDPKELEKLITNFYFLGRI